MATFWQYANPFYAEQRTLLTQLPPGECERRLRERILPWLSMGVLSPFTGARDLDRMPVTGSASGGAFDLTRIQRNRRQSLRLSAVGRFEPVAAGTAIRVRFGASRGATAFIAVWLIALLLFAIWLSTLAPADAGARALPAAGLPLLVVALCVLLLYFSGRAARSDTAFLLAFLAETLQATEHAPDRPDTTPLNDGS